MVKERYLRIRRSPGTPLTGSRRYQCHPSNNGIDLRIVATDPHHTGNYLRNIKVVTAANEAAAKSWTNLQSDLSRTHSEFSRPALYGLVPDQRQYPVVMD
jgi:hypothetical protein